MSHLLSTLPGLYVAGLTLLLALALRRGWDPVPPRVLAVFALVLILLLGPALLGGRVLLPLDILARLPPFQNLEPPSRAGNSLQMDLVTQVVPWQAQVRRSIKAGEWPLWNDLAGAGMPLLADPQAQVLQPLILLALPFPLAQAVGVTAALRVLCALIFTFLFLRKQGLGEWASLAGSLAHGLGGFLLLWLGWPIANAAALLPLLLYAVAWVHDRGARRDVLLLTVAAAAVLVSGHPETSLYALGVAALFALTRLVAGAPERRRPTLLRWTAAGLIAFGLSAPALLPAFRYLPQTHRNELVERRNARIAQGEEPREAGDAVPRRLAPLVWPNAFGNERLGAYWGEMNFNETGSGFAGSSMLLLALIALFPARSRRLPQEWLFLGLALVSTLVVARPPGLARLLTALPVLDRSATFHQRLAMVLVFSLAYAGSCVLDRWRTGDRPRWRLVGCAAVLALALAGAFRISTPPPGAAPAEASRLLWLGLHGTVLAATAALLAARIRNADRLVTLLIAGELLFLYAPSNPTLPRRLYYPESPALERVREGAAGYRIAGLGGALPPNTASVFGLADARISSPFKPFLYTQAIAPLSRSLRATEDVFVRPQHPLYRLLGVRYVLVRPGTRLKKPLRRVVRNPSLWVYETPEPLPRLFLPRSAETAGDRPWNRWLASNPDFAERALVAPAADRPPRWSAVSPARARLDLRVPAATRLRADFQAPEARLLASSVYQDGGWRLLIDERPAPSLTANGPFVAAWLPAGPHRVDLLYRAPGLLTGCLLAALALAGAALGLTPPPRPHG